MSDKIVHTGIYSKLGEDLLKCFAENLGQYWATPQIDKARSYFSVIVEPDGEVCIKLFDANSYDFRRTIFGKHKNDNDTRQWFAAYIKGLIMRLIKRGYIHNGKWNRSDSVAITCMAKDTSSFVPTISQFYMLYEKLKNRKNFEKHFHKKTIKEFIGKQLDPISAEIERARRVEESKIAEKYERMIKAERNEVYVRIRQARERLEKESEENIKRLQAEKLKEIEKLNTNFTQPDSEAADINSFLDDIAEDDFTSSTIKLAV